MDFFKKQRKSLKFSQKTVADRLHMPQSHYSRIESEKLDPRLSTVMQIAQTLNLQVVIVPKDKMTLVNNILFSTPGDSDLPRFMPDEDIE